MARKHDLQHSIYQVLLKNRDGAYATRDDRKQILMRFAEDVTALGFGLIQKQLSKGQRAIDKQARLIITEELP